MVSAVVTTHVSHGPAWAARQETPAPAPATGLADQRSASDWQSDRYVMAKAPKAVNEVNSGVYATLAGLICLLAWWEEMI